MDIDIRKDFNISDRERACFIFGAGEFYGLKTETRRDDFIIAADGGLKHAKGAGLRPDLIVGDFDSSKAPENEGCDIMRLSSIKDLSDLSEALSEGTDRGYSLFFVYGCTGGRPDHTYSAIQDAARLSKSGIRVYMFFKDYVLTAVTEGKIEFPKSFKGMVSVFAHSDICEGVRESGLKYIVADHVLKNDTPLGLSNEFTGLPASVSVGSGTLIVMFEMQGEQDGGDKVERL